MPRPITPADADVVVRIAVASGLFGPEEADVVTTMVAEYLAHGAADGHVCVVEEDGDAPVATAYYEPARATDRSWYLTMIAVTGAQQGRGRGTALLRSVEDDLRERGERLLLVETSGLPAFARTRAFYRACGYDEEARVRDYYSRGDDMVLFRKAL